jgi:hypothetical protein
MGNIPRKFLCFCLRFEDLLATATVPCNNLNLERHRPTMYASMNAAVTVPQLRAVSSRIEAAVTVPQLRAVSSRIQFANSSPIMSAAFASIPGRSTNLRRTPPPETYLPCWNLIQFVLGLLGTLVRASLIVTPKFPP